MIVTLFRLLLIFWIISILMRWFKRSSTENNTGSVKGGKPGANKSLDDTGPIDDADFEEIEDS